MTPLEICANALNALSIFLAGRNSIHTWGVGIVACMLFGVLFWHAKLYADASLQLFFIGSSVAGFLSWRDGRRRHELPVRHARRSVIGALALAGIAVTLGYAFLLHALTDAAAPLPDSAVLAFSVVAQLLLLKRFVETWWFWLIVNTISVPLYVSRGLHLTALLYTAYWLYAIASLAHWRRLARPS